jgi:hypothetical protein
MASNTSSGCWSVKIIHLPASITIDQLAQTFNILASRIIIPKTQKFSTYFAWINDFASEKDARDFADQWSGSSVFGTTIKCNAIEPKQDDPHLHHELSKLSVSDVKTSSDVTSSNEPFKSYRNSGFKETQNSAISPSKPVPLMTPQMTRPPNTRPPFIRHPNQTPQHPPQSRPALPKSQEPSKLLHVDREFQDQKEILRMQKTVQLIL